MKPPSPEGKALLRFLKSRTNYKAEGLYHLEGWYFKEPKLSKTPISGGKIYVELFCRLTIFDQCLHFSILCFLNFMDFPRKIYVFQVFFCKKIYLEISYTERGIKRETERDWLGEGDWERGIAIQMLCTQDQTTRYHSPFSNQSLNNLYVYTFKKKHSVISMGFPTPALAPGNGCETFFPLGLSYLERPMFYSFVLGLFKCIW